MTTVTIGIDMSKAHLDAHRLPAADHARFGNAAAGPGAFAQWLGPVSPGLLVYEPTGCRLRHLETDFPGRFPMVKVDTLQARRFARAHGTRARV